MAKVLKFGKRQAGPLPEVEERLAHLQEELALSSAFVDAMLRDGHLKAAAGVLGEQQARLAACEHGMLRAFARPAARKRRMNAAIAGLAAVMLVGGAAFAALGLHDHASKPASAPAVIHDASQRLAAAERLTGSDGETTQVVAATLNDIKAIGDTSKVDPTIRDGLSQVITQQLNLLRHTRSAAATSLRHEIEELQRKIADEARAAKSKGDQSPASPSSPSSPAPPPAPPAPEAS